MPWVRFTADHDWKPVPSVTVAFKAGHEKLVTRACASQAIAKGKAEKIKAPQRQARHNGQDGASN